MSKFIIKDWACNVKFNGKKFDSFEEAWDHIYEYAEGCDDGDYSDFYVDEHE